MILVVPHTLNQAFKNAYSHNLEGAVGRLDEPELSDVAPWEAVDR